MTISIIKYKKNLVQFFLLNKKKVLRKKNKIKSLFSFDANYKNSIIALFLNIII